LTILRKCVFSADGLKNSPKADFENLAKNSQVWQNRSKRLKMVVSLANQPFYETINFAF
jgi:hypothetical protein